MARDTSQMFIEIDSFPLSTIADGSYTGWLAKALAGRPPRKSGLRFTTRLIAIIAAAALPLGATPLVTFSDLATSFERVAIGTANQPEVAQIAAVRRTLDPLLPGVYPTDAKMDRRIAIALAEFPAQRVGYDLVIRDFPAVMARAVARFRTVFPRFSPPVPIYLYHSLGLRDGGADYLEPGHRHIMFFGADMIAKFHADNSLEPFFDHELFHLEHARAFSDCDQFWCELWQDGLAVAAPGAMTPGATDHQLLLDQPKAIREPTDSHCVDALCFVAAHFDDTRGVVAAQALQGGGKPPSGLPDRFGYYVGYRLARATGQTVPALDRLGHHAARRLLRSTLVLLMANAKAGCGRPAIDAAITHRAPHAV